ncbi:hypothetical protein [Marinomonas ostreistagni]|uniref:hypothetical protein n=1 Tax=Marinomonas ostreistagni TaxID=359209 RepID=UPI00194EACCF|nr:hypothetical protein [Marinomonas ostreistagni]MBM6550526.1 hypothetical protein [Marinomonas ostreistagni]
MQPEFSLQRFLDANPSQQPLMEQLQARVVSQPTPTSAQNIATQKIAVVLRGQRGELKNRAWLMAFKRRLREFDLATQVDIFYLPKHELHKVANPIFETIIETDYDYIVMDGLDEFSRPSIERILNRTQAEVLMLDVVAPVKAWRYHPPLIYIGVDLPKAMHRLASYIDRVLPIDTIVDVIMVRDAFDNGQRCQVFMNEWMSTGRKVNRHVAIANEAQLAFHATQELLQQTQRAHPEQQHFIFSCTPEVSFGVLGAIMEHDNVLTNAWNGQDLSDPALRQQNVLVTVLDMYDNMAIAAAEAIKADLESRLLPDVYMETSLLLFQEMDDETRDIMFQQAFRYSFRLWPH